MVGVSEEEGVLEDVEKEMIFNVFDFADAQVKDVMVQKSRYNSGRFRSKL